MSEIVTSSLHRFPVILGRKPLDLPQPTEFRVETEIEHSYEHPLPNGEVEEWVVPLHTYVKSRTYKLFAAGRHVATTRRFAPVRDKQGNAVAIRLYKNQTDLH